MRLATSSASACVAASAGILREQEPGRLQRLPDAPGRVQARRQRKRDRVEVHVRRGDPGTLEERGDPGPGRAAHLLEAQSRDRSVLAHDRGHVGDRSDGREVRELERGRGTARFVGQDQLRDLEGDAAAGQAHVRVARVGAMRVDDRDGRRQGRGQPMVVRDDHVDATRGRDGDLGRGARPRVDRDDDADAVPLGRVDGRDRQAVPLVQPARDVRIHGQAVAPQREDEDREAIEAVRVEVAEDHDPLGSLAGRGQASEQAIGIGQEAWVVQAVQRIGEPGIQAGRVGHPAPCEQARHPLPDAASERGVGEILGHQPCLGEAPAEAGFQHVLRMPRGAHLRLYRSRRAA